MIDLSTLKHLEQELNGINVRVKLVMHKKGIDIIGHRIVDRYIARQDLLNFGVPREKLFHFSPKIEFSRV